MPRSTKMIAVQALFHDDRVVPEGEVFLFYGNELPTSEVAILADEDMPLGSLQRQGPPIDPRKAPAWTTKGFVDRAHTDAGRRAAEAAALMT